MSHSSNAHNLAFEIAYLSFGPCPQMVSSPLSQFSVSLPESLKDIITTGNT